MEAKLAELYPERRFDRRVETDYVLTEGLPAALANTLARRLAAPVIEVPLEPEEYCRHLYVLCLGRPPGLIEARAGLVAVDDLELAGEGEPDGSRIEELYLRVSLSEVAPFAAVQQVLVSAERLGPDLMIVESTRAGVFDPVLLPRMQKVVAIIAEHGLRHLDFGDMNEPPAGFSAGDYGERFGGLPALANYFFYPQPCSSITTTVVRGSAGAQSRPEVVVSGL